MVSIDWSLLQTWSEAANVSPFTIPHAQLTKRVIAAVSNRWWPPSAFAPLEDQAPCLPARPAGPHSEMLPCFCARREHFLIESEAYSEK